MKEFKIHEEEKINAGFRVPDDYFESFTDRIMAQLEDKAVPKVIPLHRRIPTWLSAAAAFVLLLGVGWFVQHNRETAPPDAATIENYLVYNSNISTYDLTQQLNEQDIKQLETSLAISDDAIEEYLLYENIYE